jgi:hypothetical protein
MIMKSNSLMININVNLLSQSQDKEILCVRGMSENEIEYLYKQHNNSQSKIIK